jgi:hypothetical protein
LNCANIGGPGIALVPLVTLRAFLARGTLWTLWTLRSSLPLRTGDTLNSLRTLRACGTLWTGVAFRAGLFSTCSE